MDELQLILIIIGFIFVIFVFIYNSYIEYKINQRRSKKNFFSNPLDILFPKKNKDEENPIEIDKSKKDTLQNNIEIFNDYSKAQPKEIDHPEFSDFQNQIEYVAQFNLEKSLSKIEVIALIDTNFRFKKKIILYFYDTRQSTWIEMNDVDDSNHTNTLRVNIQLIDKNGIIEFSELLQFNEYLKILSNKIAVNFIIAELNVAETKIIELEEFKKQVGFLLGISVVSPENNKFSSLKINALANEYGMVLDHQGFYVYFDKNKNCLFTICNKENLPFPGKTIEITTSGITFLLDIPLLSGELKSFEISLNVCKRFAESLDGIIVDDRNLPLTENGIINLNDKLIEVYRLMNNKNIPPGSKTARRLFL